MEQNKYYELKSIKEDGYPVKSGWYDTNIGRILYEEDKTWLITGRPVIEWYFVPLSLPEQGKCAREILDSRVGGLGWKFTSSQEKVIIDCINEALLSHLLLQEKKEEAIVMSNEEIEKIGFDKYPVQLESTFIGRSEYKDDANKHDRNLYIEGMKAHRNLIKSK